MKKIIFIFCIFFCTNNLKSSSVVTTKFHNTIDFPVLFQSFADDNTTQPIESTVIKPTQSFVSKIYAQSKVNYTISAYIQPQTISMSTGSKNVVFHNLKFYLKPATLRHKDSNDAYLSDTSVARITNATPFPINIHLIIKDMGQVIPTLVPDPEKNNLLVPDPIPAQAINQTRLPRGGSYSVDDSLSSITISCALKPYHLKDVPLARVKSKYMITYDLDKIIVNNS